MAGIAALDDEERALLHALAAGSPLDAEVLADLLEVPSGSAGELVPPGPGPAGCCWPPGRLVPLVPRRPALQVTPADVTRSTPGGCSVCCSTTAKNRWTWPARWPPTRCTKPRAAQLLERHGTAALCTVAPDLAGKLLGAAADAGSAPPPWAARRAQAAALTGDLDGTLQSARAPA